MGDADSFQQEERICKPHFADIDSGVWGTKQSMATALFCSFETRSVASSPSYFSSRCTANSSLPQAL